MASAEQPLKKRKLYDPYPDHPPVFPQSQHPHPHLHHHHHHHHQGFAPPPPAPLPSLSPEEILRRRRNRDEIRSMYDCYRQIKYCVSQKDPRLMGDLEKAYLSLITASRGCTSVQRVVAELIPRYASYCPTALEAATKVSINMYSWSFAIIMRGEDLDGVAYQTAKACIFGLVDICSTAANEAPTSSVIRGICSAVFQNVLTFFTSTFEGKDIYQIGRQEILKLQEPMEFFCDIKQDNADDNEPILYKLFKFRALSLLRIFFSFPKNLLAACFELLSSGTDAVLYKRGGYFLSQVTSRLNAEDIAKVMDKRNEEASLCKDSLQVHTDFKGMSEVKSLSNDGCVSEKSVHLEDCFLGMVAKKDQCLRRWTLTRYKKLCESLASPDIPDVSSILEKIFGSISLMNDEEDYEDSEDDKFDSSKYINPSYLAHKTPIRHKSADITGKDYSSIVDTPREGNTVTEDIGQNVKPHRSVTPSEVDALPVDEIFKLEGERSVPRRNMDIELHENVIPEKASTPKDFKKNNIFSPVTRKQTDLISDDSGESRIIKGGKNQGSSIHVIIPAASSTSEDTPNISPFIKQHLVAEHHVFSSQVLWYCDGDPASMEIFSASKQLWLSSLGCDASETLVKLQFEDFGPLDQCFFFPAKDFALIEYRSIMDAVKAREYMQGSSLWGGCLRIKFLDRGLGSRGTVNSVAVGDSCHIYIGKVFNQWTKDEIMHELMRVGMRTPRSVTDLMSESALLLEFWTAEEATTAMEQIRQQRREAGFHIYPNNSLSLSAHTKDKFISGCQLLVRQIDSSVTDDELINAFSRFGELTGWHFNRPSGCCLIDFRSYEAADFAKLNLHGARFGPTSIHVEVKTDNSQTGANSMLLSLPATKYSVNSCRSRISHADACPSDLESTRPNLYSSSFTNKPENRIHDHVSPRVGVGNFALQAQSGHPFQSSWTATRSSELLDVGSRKVDDNGSSKTLDLSYAEGPGTSHGAEHFWKNEKQEIEPLTTAQGITSISTYGASSIPPPIPGPSVVRPLFLTSGSSWDTRVLNPCMPNQSLIGNSNRHVNAYPVAPFIPSSVTPISQLPGGSMQGFNVPRLPNAVLPPPQFDVQSSFPSPPPLPLSLPPFVPPPPSSPPPATEPSNLRTVEGCPLYEWQGSLSKSGVHYCMVYATREDSAACRYSNAIPEPVDWPARLDVTKRTDIRHVKTTFGITPPQKREVCRLLPSAASDQKGLHDFISYLKQRECAGVIKIPAGKDPWARLLFILPYSFDTCSMLEIAPHPAECLIALVLPKETNSEVV